MGKTQVGNHSAIPVVFDNTSGTQARRHERITQSHPLVRFITDHHKQSDSMERKFKVCAAKVSALKREGLRSGIYVYLIERWIVSGAKDVERLEYCIIAQDDPVPIDSDEAELLVNTVAHHGEDWLGAANEVDCSMASSLFEVCDEWIEIRRNEYDSAQKREDADRRNMMILSIARHLEKQKNKIVERIEKYRSYDPSKYAPLIRMDQGKLKKLEDRLGGKLAELRLKKEPDLRYDLVSTGIIKVY